MKMRRLFDILVVKGATLAGLACGGGTDIPATQSNASPVASSPTDGGSPAPPNPSPPPPGGGPQSW